MGEKLVLLINVFLLAVGSMFWGSCKSQGIDQENLVDRGDSIALEYIQSFIEQGEKIDTIYINIHHYDNYKGCINIYALSVFSSRRPIENQKMPFAYSILKRDDKLFVSYHYSDFHTFDTSSMRNILKKLDLLVPVDDEGAFLMEDLQGHLVVSEESWHCFFNKVNISEVKVLASFKAIVIREKPQGCNLSEIN